MELRLLNRSSLCLFMFFIFFINSPVISLGSNILTTADKPLTLAVTLVSTNGRFEMGFFTPGNSSVYYAGIWYRQIAPQTVVWVANRRAPISSPDMDSAQLNIIDGNLVLRTGSGKSLWSTNLNLSKNSVQATLLDTGNLVLTDGAYSNATPPLWQSFDHPADTLMPGAKLGYNKRTNEKQSLISWRNSEDPDPGPYSLEIDPDVNQFVVKWNGTEQYWTSGPWDGNEFKDIPNTRPNQTYNFTYVNNAHESYSTYFLTDPSLISRFTITVTGQIQQFTWSDTDKQWHSVFNRPENQCYVYNSCGPYGVCNQNSSSVCECLPGFSVKSDSDRRLNDFSGGCVRISSLQCVNATAQKDKFDSTTNMRLPRHPQNVTARSSAQCESVCLGNCSCTAYAYDGSNGCSIWNGEILDMSKDDRNGSTIQIRLAGSVSGGLQAENQKSSGKLKAIIPATIAGAIPVVCLFIYIYYRHRRNAKHRENESSNQGIQLYEGYDSDGDGTIEEHDEKNIDIPFFSFESILVATNNFSDANKLGRGGFGPVYKGVFQGGREIAVKRLSNESGQGSDEFKNEVILIAKLQHRNLVRLLGYCIKGKEKILLYEYMPHKSLDTWIFDRNLSVKLDWEKRFDIILGIARGLLYLHHDSRLRVIHRDLKTSNILLDEEMNPKISDFGLARIVEGKRTEANTNKVVGTYGYMSPEYALDGLFSTKSDVFSFGVVVLEIVSGKKNSGAYHLDESANLLGYAWRLWNEERTRDLVDQSLLPLEPDQETEIFKCINVGLLCVQEDPGVRPSMSNVLIMFGSDSMSIPRANQPAFVARARMTSGTSSSTCSSKPYSNNQMTITAQEGR